MIPAPAQVRTEGERNRHTGPISSSVDFARPRTILARQLERLRQKGYIFHVGVEAEFMLLKKDGGGNYSPWDPLDTIG